MTTTPANAAPPEASADASAPSSSSVTSDVVDIDALKAAAAELAVVKAEQASAKAAAKEERKRLQAEAEAAGEMQKAYDAAKARLAELEGLEPLAQKWRAYEAEEAKRLAVEAATLPEAVRDLYATAGDIDAKRKVLAAFRAAAPSTQTQKGTPPSMGAPPAVSGADFEAALADKSGKKAAEMKARDPVGFAAWMREKISGGKPAASSLGFGRFQSKAPNA
jgi:uncharacterized protein YcbK (DUF882 family)